MPGGQGPREGYPSRWGERLEGGNPKDAPAPTRCRQGRGVHAARRVAKPWTRLAVGEGSPTTTRSPRPGTCRRDEKAQERKHRLPSGPTGARGTVRGPVGRSPKGSESPRWASAEGRNDLWSCRGTADSFPGPSRRAYETPHGTGANPYAPTPGEARTTKRRATPWEMALRSERNAWPPTRTLMPLEGQANRSSNPPSGSPEPEARFPCLGFIFFCRPLSPRRAASAPSGRARSRPAAGPRGPRGTPRWRSAAPVRGAGSARTPGGRS